MRLRALAAVWAPLVGAFNTSCTPSGCPPGRTPVDGVCVSEAAADFRVCLQSWADKDTNRNTQLGSDVSALGAKASLTYADVATLRATYPGSDAAITALLNACGQGFSPHSQMTKDTEPGSTPSASEASEPPETTASQPAPVSSGSDAQPTEVTPQCPEFVVKIVRLMRETDKTDAQKEQEYATHYANKVVGVRARVIKVSSQGLVLSCGQDDLHITAEAIGSGPTFDSSDKKGRLAVVRGRLQKWSSAMYPVWVSIDSVSFE